MPRAVLANAKTLQDTWLGALSYLSILRYCFELVMSNELLGQYVKVTLAPSPLAHPCHAISPCSSVPCHLPLLIRAMPSPLVHPCHAILFMSCMPSPRHSRPTSLGATCHASPMRIQVTRMFPGDPGHGDEPLVSGFMIVHDYLGFNADFTEGCMRVIDAGTSAPQLQTSACWYDTDILHTSLPPYPTTPPLARHVDPIVTRGRYDLYIPAIWFVAAVVMSIVLLKFCARDPH